MSRKKHVEQETRKRSARNFRRRVHKGAQRQLQQRGGTGGGRGRGRGGRGRYGRREEDARRELAAELSEEQVQAALEKLPEELRGPEAPDEGRPRVRARVIAVHRGWAEVRIEGESHDRLCAVLGSIWVRGTRASALAAGDHVEVVKENEDRGILVGVLPRARTLSRISTTPGLLKKQVIAAHVDRVVLVASMRQPPFNPGLVDRVLATCFHNGLAPTLCINKADLLKERDLEKLVAYEDLEGLTLHFTCALDGRGVEELAEIVSTGTTVMTGMSGVGKSELIRQLIPGNQQAVGAVSKTSGYGRHTTTGARLIDVPGGGFLIDTPGVRAFAPWAIPRGELLSCFPDLAGYAEGCTFADCEHLEEDDPGCAVRAAVEAGDVFESRYQSYERLMEAMEEFER